MVRASQDVMDRAAMFMQQLRSVLVLEDESLLSLTIEEALRELGAQHVASFTDHQQATEHARTGQFDCAVLDVIIRGQPNFEVADVLDARGIPFVFSSGVSADEIDHRHRHRPFVGKPFSDDDLKASIRRAMDGSKPGDSAGPA